MTCAEIIAIIDVVITSILTGIIIWQSYSLHKKQQKLEEEINQSQLEMQRRQTKLAVYEYRRTTYEQVVNIFSFCETIQNLNKYIDWKKASTKGLETYFREEFDKNNINRNRIDYYIIEAKHLFPRETSYKIEFLGNSADAMFDMMTNLTLFSKKLSKDDSDKPQDIVNIFVDSVFEIIDKIMNIKPELLEELDGYLDVSTLEE